MTLEAQRIAMAEISGWKYPCSSCFNNGYKDRWRTPNKDGCVSETDLPNFFEDLNAVYKVEEKLSKDDKVRFYWMLAEVVNPMQLADKIAFSLVHATAAQRTEAILRTLGKWIEKPK